MKILVKYNLLLLILFAITMGVTSYVARGLLQDNARVEVQDTARLLMQSAIAVRSYTVSQIKPLLDGQNHYKFLPQTVSAYAATEYFNNVRSVAPQYSYKEATLNPTNPRDRATGWEVEVVNHFRNNPELQELIGDRDGELGKTLYFAHPLKIKDPACLACHSTVDAAPPTMIEAYGNANGFGWQPDEIVGAQVVSVPYGVALKRADAIVGKILILLACVFVVLFVALNAMLATLVLRPIARLGQVADSVSLGKMDAPEFAATGSDEIAALAKSFNRMRRSLFEAIQMLEK